MRGKLKFKVVSSTFHLAYGKSIKINLKSFFKIFLTCSRVQSHGVVKNYRENKVLRNFVRSYIGLAQVPPNRLEEAFAIVNKRYTFEDQQEIKFKVYMEQYFLKYWLHNKVNLSVC